MSSTAAAKKAPSEMEKLMGASQTAEELFAATDFADKDSMVKLFPAYVQAQHEHRKISKKPQSNTVQIDNFNMKTPFGDAILVKSSELTLESGKRQCLYGANSTGKTLLMSNMSEGKIKDFPKHLHVHHCKELENHELSDTVLGTVVNCYPFRNILLKCQAHLKQLVPAETDADCKSKLVENLDYVEWNLRTIRSDDAEDRASKMLRVLGFDDIGQKKLVSALSGGLRMRVALCMAFFIEADLLLLDEPTNHLDFPSVLWLENRLRGYRGSFLLVSHDRELLNNVCTSVMMLEDQQIKYYNCGFKDFEKKKAAEDKKKFEEIEKFLQKNLNVDPSTMLGKQKHEKKEWSQNYYQKQIALAGKFTFPVATELLNDQKNADGTPVKAEDISLINLKDVTFSYDVSTGHFIFGDPISFNVTATTRVGVMGPNGAGKSTLLKLLTHKLTATTGTVTHHPNFTLAYFGQHSTAELNLEMTPAEFMGQQFPGEPAGVLRNHLAKTSIVGATQDTRMQRLLFSQRSCIIFAKLTFVCPHLLILDEPTNFLDLESVDSLIAACNKYRGALLLVSHNRDFLRKCATGYLSVVPGKFALYDNMKTAESATYSFIAEMEEGGKVGASALANNPGGGTLHSSQNKNAAAAQAADKPSLTSGVMSMTIASAPAKKPTTAAAGAAATGAGTGAAAVTYAVGEKCQALWSDGKYYAALVQKVAAGKYTIKYTAYGNTATIPATQLKKAAPAPAAGAATAAAGAGAKAQPAKK